MESNRDSEVSIDARDRNGLAAHVAIFHFLEHLNLVTCVLTFNHTLWLLF